MYQGAAHKMTQLHAASTPGHLQDVREATTVLGTQEEEVGHRLVGGNYLPRCCLVRLLPSPCLLLPSLPLPLSSSPYTHSHKGVITMSWLMFVKMYRVREQLKARRGRHLESHQHRARVQLVFSACCRSNCAVYGGQ